MADNHPHAHSHDGKGAFTEHELRPNTLPEPTAATSSEAQSTGAASEQMSSPSFVGFSSPVVPMGSPSDDGDPMMFSISSLHSEGKGNNRRAPPSRGMSIDNVLPGSHGLGITPTQHRAEAIWRGREAAGSAVGEVRPGWTWKEADEYDRACSEAPRSSAVKTEPETWLRWHRETQEGLVIDFETYLKTTKSSRV